MITIDARDITSRGEDAMMPVTTAVYTVQFVMNEDNPTPTDNHIEAFTAEIQRVMDEADFTTALRYDAVNFEVVSRIVIATTTPEDDDARDHAETMPGSEALEDISYKFDDDDNLGLTPKF